MTETTRGTRNTSTRARPSYAAHAYSANDFTVTSGANLGDPLIIGDDLCAGDIYMLDPQAHAWAMTIRDRAANPPAPDKYLVADDSELGQPGDMLTLAGRMSLIAADGDKVDLVLIAHHPKTDAPPALLFVPMAPIEPKVQYTLLSATEDCGEVHLSDITPVAFTRGTLITLANGTQSAIEDLRPGDKVLTRDHGPQSVRWIGQRTVRAIGTFAPVVITRGTLSNESDLIVSQLQRLFIYQQGNDRLTHTAEVLVKARDLVDGDAIFIRRGGFVEYFHLVFDRHEIIYAEYTPTESLLLNDRSLDHMPEDLARDVAEHLPDAAQQPHFGTDADKTIAAKLAPHRSRRD